MKQIIKWHRFKARKPFSGTKALVGVYNRYEKKINIVDLCYYDGKRGVWFSLPNMREWEPDYYNFWAKV